MSSTVPDQELLLLIQERLAKLELEAAEMENEDDFDEEDCDDEDYDSDEDYDTDEDDEEDNEYLRTKSKYSQLGHELAALDKMKNRERERQLVRSYMGQEFAIVDERRAHERARNTQLVRSYQIEGVGSKALPAQYHFKEAPAFDLRMAQNRHHTGSHYVMAGSKQFQRGVRVKGVVSRHSKQAALRNGVVLASKGKISKKARLRRKQSLARSEI